MKHLPVVEPEILSLISSYPEKKEEDVNWKLFLDDERFPKEEKGWIIIRSAEEAMDYIEKKGCPQYISFDHDLGHGIKTGMDLAKWLVERDLDRNGFIPRGFSFYVHSANPIGAMNINMYLMQYLNKKINGEKK